MHVDWAKAGWLLLMHSHTDIVNLMFLYLSTSCKAMLHVFHWCLWAIAYKLASVFVALSFYITWFNTATSPSSHLVPCIINDMLIWKCLHGFLGRKKKKENSALGAPGTMVSNRSETPRMGHCLQCWDKTVLPLSKFSYQRIMRHLLSSNVWTGQDGCIFCSGTGDFKPCFELTRITT